jgi:hypothetical protein
VVVGEGLGNEMLVGFEWVVKGGFVVHWLNKSSLSSSSIPL